MACRNVLIFANPVAGRGRAGAIAAELTSALRAAGWNAMPVLTPPSTTVLPEQAVGAAIAIGGDGTLRAVVSRLATPPDRPVGPRSPSDPWVDPPPIVIVPMGTANLMHQSLGLPKRPADLSRHVLELLTRGRVVRRDVSLANGELFLIVAGAGLDGEVIHTLHAVRNGPITLGSYVMPTLRSLAGWRFPRIDVWADGRHVFGPQPGMAMVGNVREHGLGFSFLSRAVPDDGWMDLLAFTCRSVGHAVDRFLETATDQLIGADGVVYLRARHVEVRSEAAVAVQADGEAAGFTPLSVELLPRQVRFLTLPENA
ncbi:MAG: diacylglycerol/lipid kinase family protein [Tepidisphaerales bacterium]